MKTTYRLLAATSALALSATYASAELTQEAIDALTQKLMADGYATEIRIKPDGDEVKVIATGAAGTTERTYTIDATTLLKEETEGADGYKIETKYNADGSLAKEEVETADGKIERKYDAAGNLVKEEYETADGTQVEREWDSEGNLLKQEVENDSDDDRDEDDRDEDEDDDRDDDDQDEDDADDKDKGD